MVSLWCLSVAALVGESLALNINGQPQQLEVADCSNVMDLAQFCQEHHGVKVKGPSCTFGCSTTGDIYDLDNVGTMTLGGDSPNLDMAVSSCNTAMISEFCILSS